MHFKNYKRKKSENNNQLDVQANYIYKVNSNAIQKNSKFI